MEMKYDPLTGKIVPVSSYGLGSATKTEYYTVTESCKTWFETDSENTVVKYRFEGSGCPSETSLDLW